MSAPVSLGESAGVLVATRMHARGMQACTRATSMHALVTSAGEYLAIFDSLAHFGIPEHDTLVR